MRSPFRSLALALTLVTLVGCELSYAPAPAYLAGDAGAVGDAGDAADAGASTDAGPAAIGSSFANEVADAITAQLSCVTCAAQRLTSALRGKAEVGPVIVVNGRVPVYGEITAATSLRVDRDGTITVTLGTVVVSRHQIPDCLIPDGAPASTYDVGVVANARAFRDEAIRSILGYLVTATIRACVGK